MEITGFLHKAFAFQCKALLCFLPPLLVMFALPHLETPMIMPTMWHIALTGFFQGPAFAFLLLNCLVVTIIASSKLPYKEKGALEEESNNIESPREIERGGANFLAENVLVPSQNLSTKNYGCDFYNEGKDFLRSSCSLNASYNGNKIKKEPVNVNLNEKKLVSRRARLAACRRSDKELGLHANKPLSHKKLIRDGPALEKNNDDNIVNEKCMKGLGRAGNISDHQALQHPASAAVARPSLEEVWAAIMSSNKNDQHSKQSNYGNDHQSTQRAAATDAPSPPAAAAPAPPAAAPTPPAAAVAANNPLRAAEAAPNPSKAHAVVTEKHEDGDDDQANDSELEELNRRAEEFIARFNNQMRLQRQESLQRERARAARRPCTYDIQYPRHVQIPARGLLVG